MTVNGIAFQFGILTSQILGMPQVAIDPKFATPCDRVTNREELIDIITKRLKEESRDVWIEKFKGKG